MESNIRVLMSLFVEDTEYGKIELNANYDKEKNGLKAISFETFKEAVVYVMNSCPDFSATPNLLKLSLGLTPEFVKSFPDIYQGLLDFKKLIDISPIRKKTADEWIYKLIVESAKSNFRLVDTKDGVLNILKVPHLSFDSVVAENSKQKPSSLKITIVNVES